MTKTYLHAHLKSNPEGSIELWVSEKEKPEIIISPDLHSQFEISSRNSKNIEEWQSSLVCFPTLPEQREEIMNLVIPAIHKHKSELAISISEFLKKYAVDCDPGLFEFISPFIWDSPKPSIVYAVLKSTPAQKEPTTYPKDEWQYFFGTMYNRYYKSTVNGKRVEMNITRKGVEYAIGNFDEAKEKYKSEEELISALTGSKKGE